MMGTTHGVPPERLETLHFAVGSRRLIARSRALPEIRPKLGFLESDFETWLLSTRVMMARRGCGSERCCLAGAATRRPGCPSPADGQAAHGRRPDECDHGENWWDGEEGEDHKRRLQLEPNDATGGE